LGVRAGQSVAECAVSSQRAAMGAAPLVARVVWGVRAPDGTSTCGHEAFEHAARRLPRALRAKLCLELDEPARTERGELAQRVQAEV